MMAMNGPRDSGGGVSLQDSGAGVLNTSRRPGAAESAVELAAGAGVSESLAQAASASTGSDTTAEAEGTATGSGLAVGATAAMWLAAATGAVVLVASVTMQTGVEGAVAWLGLVAAAAAGPTLIGDGEGVASLTGR